MKFSKFFFAALGAACFYLTSPAMAAVLVNDTWLDGNRDEPDAPTNLITYAENNGVIGVDADSDGDLESRWFKGGEGTLDPVGPGGPLRGNMLGDDTPSPTSSASWTTYFTDAEGNEVNLANVGDKMVLTWQFSLTGVNASNSSQGLRIAVVDSPNNRIAANGTPGNAAYTGYGIFGNMGVNFGHSRPWDLMTRNGGGALLSSSGTWASAGVQDGTNGALGYADGVNYTFTFEAERLANDELEVTTSMAGQGLNGGAGLMTSTYVDASPASFLFDTFALRPSQAVQTATIFDTSLFRVEFIPLIPEPTSFALLGLSTLALALRRKR